MEQQPDVSIKMPQNVKSIEWSAVVIRKDGTREDLGVVSHYHRNWFKWFWNEIKLCWREAKREAKRK